MKEENWDIIIKPKAKIFDLHIREIWQYRDLISRFVKRDLTSIYKQTILGPLWFFIQPVFTITIYYFMFGRIANISTGTVPSLLFYMGGLLCWNYFTECLNTTSNVFVNNANLFGKVYFPRLIVPLSSVISAFFKFLIQFMLFIALWLFYKYYQGAAIQIQSTVFILPLLIFLLALLGLSFGMLISALTTKYRDFRNLLGYALQFGLYATPIIYSLDWLKIKLPFFYQLVKLNPVTSLVEAFKFSFYGEGLFSPAMLLYSSIFSIVSFLTAVAVFNRVEKTFVDTV